ncbi:hypothetical protein MTBPR1_70185 [Candidatus Terasakiella magnetica]|uniref:Sulphotransferase Stf0 domain-containing protein n=1 Tax=Candidatus Terasakiella magnetica TaxID=1867952 RepID=A0A1C3RKY2_9PROT|nr:Stf0 family sulfotransferase [Candidatus Terasakiella magnetica]SCA57913.1 hypothetical protein MTBPR1_70185 [Candidatus Terasakiella magnetica]
MNSHPFNASEYDLADYNRPVRTYILCTAPRCGGTLLGSLLQETGKMGMPHEYFHLQENTPELAQNWGLEAPVETARYIQTALKKRTSENGVFGLKAHFSQFGPLLRKAPFQEFLKTTKAYIHITRKDLLAQAVSYAIAHQTRHWSSLQPSQTEAKYDEEMIEKCLNDILNQNTAWQKFFALNNIAPITLSYEQLLEDTNHHCQKICKAVGVEDVAPFKLESSPLAKQRNQMNEDWIERFRKSKNSFNQ